MAYERLREHTRDDVTTIMSEDPKPFSQYEASVLNIRRLKDAIV